DAPPLHRHARGAAEQFERAVSSHRKRLEARNRTALSAGRSRGGASRAGEPQHRRFDAAHPLRKARPSMRTKPYAAAIALFDEVELLDVTGPLSVLSCAGRQWNFQPFKIELVASALGSVSTRSGLRLDATCACSASSGVECLIIPGGYGARRAA